MKALSHFIARLVPRPHLAFRHLQYGKAGSAWHLFSREHDVIGKRRKLSGQTGCIHILFNRLHAQRSVHTTIALR